MFPTWKHGYYQSNCPADNYTCWKKHTHTKQNLPENMGETPKINTGLESTCWANFLASQFLD